MSGNPGAAPKAARRQRRPASWPARRGLRARLLLVIYLAGGLAPLALAAHAYPLHPGSTATEIATALGLVAFGVMLLELVLLSRFRWISDRIGIDRATQIHRGAAYVMVALIAVHPLVYAAPGGDPWPWFSGSAPELGLSAWPLATGLAAWILVAALVVTAIDRSALPWRYETWRRLHAAGALVVAVLVAVHAFTAGGYSTDPVLAAFWGVLLAAGVASMAGVYLIQPWRQRLAPYVVEAIERVGAHTWALRLRPQARRGKRRALSFRPGQFAWLKLGGRSFRGREHPFSISTAPEQAPTIGFTIKERGDFTGAIGELTVGSTAYVDGPHGHFVPDETEVPTVYICGGMGISPVLSHLRAFRAMGDRRELTLIYGAHSPAHIAERDELDALARELNLTIHYIVRHPDAQWAGATGRIDRAQLRACLPRDDVRGRRYFVCGPGPMMASVERALRELGVPRRRIVTGS